MIPEIYEVEINYRIPEPVVVNMEVAEELIANYSPLRMADIQVKRPRYRIVTDGC